MSNDEMITRLESVVAELDERHPVNKIIGENSTKQQWYEFGKVFNMVYNLEEVITWLKSLPEEE